MQGGSNNQQAQEPALQPAAAAPLLKPPPQIEIAMMAADNTASFLKEHAQAAARNRLPGGLLFCREVKSPYQNRSTGSANT